MIVPVFKGEACLNQLINEIEPLTHSQFYTSSMNFRISEVLLVHDCGPDNSDIIIEELSFRHKFVKAIWLTRNYGQHAATLAGMEKATGDWIVTLDEDGQQNPADIKKMLETAVTNSLQIVFASPINNPPHGILRNFFSSLAKKISIKLLGGEYRSGVFNSYRLIDAEIGKALSAHCRNGIYLDIALLWVANRVGYCPVVLRSKTRDSSYTPSMLFSHFWRMILTTGTRPLRVITLLGALSLFVTVTVLAYAIYSKLVAQTPVQGWASLLVFISFFSGIIMISLGVLAEYLAITMGIAMGKPLYVISNKPTRSKIN